MHIVDQNVYDIMNKYVEFGRKTGLYYSKERIKYMRSFGETIKFTIDNHKVIYNYDYGDLTVFLNVNCEDEQTRVGVMFTFWNNKPNPHLVSTWKGETWDGHRFHINSRIITFYNKNNDYSDNEKSSLLRTASCNTILNINLKEDVIVENDIIIETAAIHDIFDKILNKLKEILCIPDGQFKSDDLRYLKSVRHMNIHNLNQREIGFLKQKIRIYEDKIDRCNAEINDCKEKIKKLEEFINDN